MLQITVPEREFFDPIKQEFIYLGEQKLVLEHSLISISKWEAKWKKPFYDKKEKSMEDHAVFLQNLFHGGNGFKIDNREICAWYAEEGIRLARGRSARFIDNSAVQIIPWTDAAVRIEQLLTQGQFASTVEVAEAAGGG